MGGVRKELASSERNLSLSGRGSHSAESRCCVSRRERCWFWKILLIQWQSSESWGLFALKKKFLTGLGKGSGARMRRSPQPQGPGAGRTCKCNKRKTTHVRRLTLFPPAHLPGRGLPGSWVFVITVTGRSERPQELAGQSHCQREISRPERGRKEGMTGTRVMRPNADKAR